MVLFYFLNCSGNKWVWLVKGVLEIFFWKVPEWLYVVAVRIYAIFCCWKNHQKLRTYLLTYHICRIKFEIHQVVTNWLHSPKPTTLHVIVVIKYLKKMIYKNYLYFIMTKQDMPTHFITWREKAKLYPPIKTSKFWRRLKLKRHVEKTAPIHSVLDDPFGFERNL